MTTTNRTRQQALQTFAKMDVDEIEHSHALTPDIFGLDLDAARIAARRVVQDQPTDDELGDAVADVLATIGGTTIHDAKLVRAYAQALLIGLTLEEA